MLLLSLILAILLTSVVYFIFIFISFKTKMDLEVSSPYECGFDMNSLSRMGFSYRFFLISILFLIFDVEIALLLSLPYLILSKMIFKIFLSFILILILGLVYEIYYGSLDWL